MNIRIGKYILGPAPISMIAVFVALTICAVIASIGQARPEYPMPLWLVMLVNEGMALLATIAYGILLHFALALVERLRR